MAGCSGGTDVGNPVDLGYAGYGLSSSEAGASANGSVEVEQAWIVVTEVKVQVRDGDQCDETKTKLEVPVAVNLLGQGLPEQLAAVGIDPGEYCRLEFKWDAALATVPAGAPADLAAASIVVSGSRADGTVYVIASDRDDHIELQPRDESLVVDAKGLIIGVDFQAWLAGVNLDGAVVGAGGTIRIDRDDNQALGDLFDDNVAAGVQLFLDHDEDGRLDPEEHDGTDVVADGVTR
jgi:hypothetical protein